MASSSVRLILSPHEAHSSGHVEVTGQPPAHAPHSFLHGNRRAALAALLHDAAVLAGRRHNLPDSNMICVRPPGISKWFAARGNDWEWQSKRIDRFVFEQSAKIGIARVALLPLALDVLDTRIEHRLGHVAHRHQFDIGQGV